MAKRSLSIGINNYPGTGEDLSGCVNDANDWKTLLGSRGFKTELITDADATRARIKQEIGDLVSGAKSGDLVVITYSGHGSWQPDTSGDEDDGRDEGLCPWDYASKGLLLDDDLNDLFRGADKSARVVLISDSCHSGSVTRAPVGEEDQVGAKPRFIPPGNFLKGDLRAAAQKLSRATVSKGPTISGALLLSGCRDTEYSYDTSFQNRPNGAFTYYALKTLKALPQTATYREWYLAVRDRLPTMRLPQTPNLFGTKTQKGWRILE